MFRHDGGGGTLRGRHRVGCLAEIGSWVLHTRSRTVNTRERLFNPCEGFLQPRDVGWVVWSLYLEEVGGQRCFAVLEHQRGIQRVRAGHPIELRRTHVRLGSAGRKFFWNLSAERRER